MLLRQRMDNGGGAKLFAIGESSIGSLPRGDIVVRQDVMTITSAKQAEPFAIGAPVRAASVPTAVLVRGLERFDERNEDAKKGRIEALSDGASQSPKAIVTGGVVAPDRGAPSSFASSDASAVQNPTARIV